MQLWTISSGNLKALPCYFWDSKPPSAIKINLGTNSPASPKSPKKKTLPIIELPKNEEALKKDKQKPVIVCSLAIYKTEALSGCLDGSLLVWESTQRVETKKKENLHDASIDSISISEHM